jgi:hypothetical protein
MATNGKTVEQSDALTRFLNEHPDLTPVFSDDAVLCGFRVGTSCLSLENVQELFYVPREQRPGRRLGRAAHAHVVAESHTSPASPPE